MITQKTRRGMMLLVLLTGVSYWATREHRDEELAPITDLDPKLDYVLHDFELQLYDSEGQITLNMKAPMLRNNPALGIGSIENPTMVFHQEDITWYLSSDSATITADKEHIKLLGHVYLKRLALLAGEQVELKTSALNLEVTPQIAETVEPVTLFDGLNRIDAVGMQLNMLDDTFKLKQQVKAVYAIY